VEKWPESLASLVGLVFMGLCWCFGGLV